LVGSLKYPLVTDSQRTKNHDLFDALGISSQQFQVIFNNLPDVSVALCKMLYDQKGVPIDFIFLDVNSPYEQKFRQKREQITSRRASEFSSLMDQPVAELISLFNKAAKAGGPQQSKFFSETKQKWVQIYVFSPKKDYFLLLCTDLSKTKKAEQKYLMSEQWFRRLYETTQDGIMARNVEGRMIDCNRAYAKMLGYSKKELKSMTVHQLLPAKWHDQREKVVQKVLQTGRSIVFEREYRRKNGSVFSASVRTWRLTDEEGKVIGIWSIVRDITEQKAFQRNLEEQADYLTKVVEDRTKRLNESERLAAIGQTAGMVGHDLRNPLQTIIGELYLARNELDLLSQGEVRTNLKESLRIIEEQANYMDKIVSDLQAFVQPAKLDKKRVNLKALVENVINSINVPSNIAVQTQTRGAFSQVNADPQLLRRVLSNLITNSVQAMPSGGNLTVKSQVCRGRATVTVIDTGTGIAEEVKPYIFTPLFTTKPRGQGFGLAACKRVIEAHGGTIKFESEEGKGAKFTIQFPID
jgi:PAS domain S-box-containing protein